MKNQWSVIPHTVLESMSIVFVYEFLLVAMSEYHLVSFRLNLFCHRQDVKQTFYHSAITYVNEHILSTVAAELGMWLMRCTNYYAARMTYT